MNTRESLVFRLLTFALVLGFSPALFAQSPPASHMKIGSVNLQWHQFVITPLLTKFFGAVRMTSDVFDLQAEEIDITTATVKGKSGMTITKATASGDNAIKSQVKGYVEDVAQGRTYRIAADHAVYVPDSSRPSGGRIDFTGHVTMTLDAPEALAAPFIANVEQETVLLGKGPGYPIIEGGEGHATFTPAQGSKE